MVHRRCVGLQRIAFALTFCSHPAYKLAVRKMAPPSFSLDQFRRSSFMPPCLTCRRPLWPAVLFLTKRSGSAFTIQRKSILLQDSCLTMTGVNRNVPQPQVRQVEALQKSRGPPPGNRMSGPPLLRRKLRDALCEAERNASRGTTRGTTRRPRGRHGGSEIPEIRHALAPRRPTA